MSVRLVVFCVVLLFVTACPVLARDYYISPAGNDADPGTRAQPWRTVAKVNSLSLEPGDRVLFEAGRVFEGPVGLDSSDSGSLEQPILLSSYGAGKAEVHGRNGRALSVAGSSHLVVSNLWFVGSGRKAGNTDSGVVISGAGNVELDQLEVTGFREAGVLINGSHDVRLTRIHAFENGFAGISSDGDDSTNVYIGYCLTENNPGDPSNKTNHSGNGIVMGKVRGGLIERCEARYNGWDMPRKGNGPVGIWAWESDRVTIQYCVSHHNRSTGIDGGGFDFDGGMKDSILQYNYSHDNHGSGYLICQYAGASAFRGNTVRYNISQDDGLTNHNAGIYVWVGGPEMESTDVYNNTIFNSKGAAVAFGVAGDYKGPLPRMTFRNNIFVAGENQIEGGAEKGRFEGNLYWAMGDGGFRVDGFDDFTKWARSTGQETIDGKIVGMYVDPLLRKDGCGLLTDPAGLPGLTEYQLLPGSPAIDRGLDLRKLLGCDVGSLDFYGNQLGAGAGFDIGAHEWTSVGATPRGRP